MSQLKFAPATVFHGRVGEKKHQFSYPIFALHFPCAEEAGLRDLLGWRFAGFLSFRAADYLDGRDRGLHENIRSFLRERCDFEAGEVSLHTMPRMFGYAFNPVSFWFCREEGNLRAVLVEVNNTFGERHFYWIAPEGGIRPKQKLRAQKVFHVSPFYPVDGYYDFVFELDQAEFRFDIRYHDDAGQLRLATWLRGEFRDLEGIGAWQILLRYGWMTPLVVFRIHWHALKLFMKKVRFHPKPPVPGKEISQ